MRLGGARGRVAVPAACTRKHVRRGADAAQWQPGTSSSGRRSWFRGSAVRQTLRELLLAARRRLPQGCCGRGPGRRGVCSASLPRVTGPQFPAARPQPRHRLKDRWNQSSLIVTARCRWFASSLGREQRAGRCTGRIPPPSPPTPDTQPFSFRDRLLCPGISTSGQF